MGGRPGAGRGCAHLFAFRCNRIGAEAFLVAGMGDTDMASEVDDMLDPFRRALSGQAEAWNDLFARLRRYVHAEVRKVLGPDAQGPLEHSAVAQSVLRRVWQNLEGRFPPDAQHADLRRFLAWVATIARNRSYDQLRQRRPATPAGSAVESVADSRDPEPVSRRDRIAVELAAALARLKESDRQVVELFWFERLSDAEISARVGKSVGAVKVKRFRALEKLRTPPLRALLEEGHDGR
jgi:RNA polymerase sigma-70 factor (ECF subfamily)